MDRDKELILEALTILCNCIFNILIAKKEYNYSEIKELNIRLAELKASIGG